MPSVKTSGLLDGIDDCSGEFVVDGANIIFMPFVFKVFKSIVYDGGIVVWWCWGSGWIKQGNGTVNVVGWEETGNTFKVEGSFGFDLFDDDDGDNDDDDDNKSSDGFNLARFRGRLVLDVITDWAILLKRKQCMILRFYLLMIWTYSQLTYLVVFFVDCRQQI